MYRSSISLSITYGGTSIIVVCTSPKKALGGKASDASSAAPWNPAINFQNLAMCAWKTNWWQVFVSKSKSEFSL